MLIFSLLDAGSMNWKNWSGVELESNGVCIPVHCLVTWILDALISFNSIFIDS